MGRVKWDSGLSAETFDNADRNQFEPYMGPPVPNGVYCFKVKQFRLGKSSGGYKQLILGLELTPRRSRPEERKFSGYYIMDYIVVAEQTAFRVAPLLDALELTGRDLLERTVTSGEANAQGSYNISKIGTWVNNGKQYVIAQLADDTDQNGAPRKKIGGYWPIPEEGSTASDNDEDEGEEEEEQRPAKKAAKKAAPRRRSEPEEEEDDGTEAEEEEEEDDTPPPRKATKKAAAKKATPRRRRAEEEEEEDDDPPF